MPDSLDNLCKMTGLAHRGNEADLILQKHYLWVSGWTKVFSTDVYISNHTQKVQMVSFSLHLVLLYR